MMESGVPITMNVEPAGSGYNNNAGFGGDWGAWIILFLIFGMFGWGGFGGWGGGFGGGSNGAGLQGIATRSDITESFAMNNLDAGIRAVQQGICDSTYALNNTISSGFANTNMGMMQGFNGVQSQISNLGFQMQDCCCQTQRAIDGVNYNMATNTCSLQNTMNSNTRDIIDSQNAGTRAILDYLCNEKISTLQAENQALRLSASQDRQSALLTTALSSQTQQILNTLNPTPVPAYPAAAPSGLGNWSPQVLAGNQCGCGGCNNFGC